MNLIVSARGLLTSRPAAEMYFRVAFIDYPRYKTNVCMLDRLCQPGNRKTTVLQRNGMLTRAYLSKGVFNTPFPDSVCMRC